MASLYKLLAAIISILPLFFALATGFTISSGTNTLEVRKIRQPPNSTAKYHHNSGLLRNTAGTTFELEYADLEKKVIKSFGANYTFSDLFTLDDFFLQADDPSVPDRKYFEFTDENIDKSQHAMFYALWTIERQDTPEFKKYGEWGAFAAEYMDTYNSRCGHDDSHCETISLGELRALYPNQRPKVRLIHFTGLKMSMLHDLQVGTEKHLNRVHTSLIARIPTMIETFAHQPDAKRLRLCDLAHKAVQATADIGFKIALAGIGAAIPAGATAFEIPWGSKEMISGAYKVIHQVRPVMFRASVGFLKGDMDEYQRGMAFMEEKTTSLNHLETLTFTFDPWAFAAPKIGRWSMTAIRLVNDHFAQDLGLDQGYNVGHMCGAWEGDDKNRNPANIRRLKESMATYFTLLESGMRDQYREMYIGTIIAPGKPTLMALYGMNLQWSGEGSVTETLKNMEPLRDAISTELEKRLISITSRRDGNYQACGHHEDAAEMCDAARIARNTPDEELPKRKIKKKKIKLTTAMRSLVCPLPETDPTLICQGGRWYWNRDFAHVVGFASLDKWDGYHGANLNLNYEDAVKEAYTNYRNYGNEMGDDVDSWGLGHVTGGGIRMPFCETEHIDIVDFSHAAPHQREKKQWQFPGICGAVGNETESFLDAIDTGYGSKNWAAHSNKQSEIEFVSLYYDRLPRIFNRQTPYLSYMQYGRVGMQFPLADQSAFFRKVWNTITAKPLPAHKRYQVTKGRDEDFAAVQEATKGMDEFAGNVWFCLDGARDHTVFQRERSHVDLIEVPIRRVNNHQSKCKKWLSEHGLNIETWRKNGLHP